MAFVMQTLDGAYTGWVLAAELAVNSRMLSFEQAVTLS